MIAGSHTVVTPEQQAAETAAKPRVSINNWAIVDLYSQPTEGFMGNFLAGVVANHPNERLNGKQVRTSRIIALLPDGGVETYNSVYILGERVS